MHRLSILNEKHYSQFTDKYFTEHFHNVKGASLVILQTEKLQIIFENQAISLSTLLPDEASILSSFFSFPFSFLSFPLLRSLCFHTIVYSLTEGISRSKDNVFSVYRMKAF